MNLKKAILALIVIAVAAGAWSLISSLTSRPTELVPAWQLTEPQRYRAASVLDPFVSWSPDSKALLFSGYSLKTNAERVYQWRVGAKAIRDICKGISPSYVNDDEFIYLKREDPKAIFIRSLATGAQREVLAALKKSEFWKEVEGFMYNPERKAVILRLVAETVFYTPGTDAYDLQGRFLGNVYGRTSEGIMDFSTNPDNSKSAILVQESEGMPVSLQIAKGTSRRGVEIANGRINCVVWSHDGKIIAYGDGTRVIALRPSDHRQIVIGDFSDAKESENKRYVSRLSWSPNNRYLAAFVYVPDPYNEYALIYVLDMAKFRW